MREETRKKVRQHFVDTTVLVAVSTPYFAGLETIVAGIPDEVSLNARLLNAGIFYGGYGYVMARGRDAFRTLCHVTDTSREPVQLLTDSIYTSLLNACVMPIIYTVSGSDDPKAIAIGTGIAAASGFASGGIMGYLLDMFRDLTGIKRTERLPNQIGLLSQETKRKTAVYALGASVLLTAGVYAVT